MLVHMTALRPFYGFHYYSACACDANENQTLQDLISPRIVRQHDKYWE